MTVDAPILRVQPENSPAEDNPSEERLLQLLAEIEAGRENFLVVKRLTDPDGQTYAQTIRRDDGQYLVEHREGDAQHHFAVVVPGLQAAHRLLTGWAFEKPGWKDGIAWSLVTL